MKKSSIVMFSGMIAVVMVLVYVLNFMPTPYVIYKPGLAEDVGPMVMVEHADVAEDSVMMLTTVRQMYPNWVTYAAARFIPNWEVFRKSDIFREGETRKDYVERQQIIMLSSQSNAIRAAYHVTNIPYSLSYEGVTIMRTIAGMPASGKLLPGDRILEIDGNAIHTSEDVYVLLADKIIGDPVQLKVERKEETLLIETVIGDFSALDSATAEEKAAGPRAGLGIQPADLIQVKADDPSRQVEIVVEDIGGPSAGLMFALEIVDQLTEGDLTRGYRIAGTGEIYPDGTVAAIGGIQHKIAAADREQAEIFFVPEHNAQAAKEKAEHMGSPMKVVSVRTIQDALDFLDALQPK